MRIDGQFMEPPIAAIGFEKFIVEVGSRGHANIKPTWNYTPPRNPAGSPRCSLGNGRGRADVWLPLWPSGAIHLGGSVHPEPTNYNVYGIAGRVCKMGNGRWTGVANRAFLPHVQILTYWQHTSASGSRPHFRFAVGRELLL